MEIKSERTQFRLTPSEKANLRHVAAATSQSESELVRQAIKPILLQGLTQQDQSITLEELKKG